MKKIACIIVAGLITTPSLAATKLNVATINGRDFDNAYVAQASGIFSKHGLDIVLTRLPTVSSVPAALVSGSSDIAPASLPIILLAADSGLDLVALCGAARLSKASPTAGLLVPSASSIHAPADLKGKRIGVNGLNAIWHLLLRRWLQDKKVDPKDVSFVEVGFPLMRDVLKGGSVDAIASISPFREAAVSGGANRSIADFAVEVNPDVNSGTWNATRAWAESHRDAASQFVASLEEANTLMREHPEEATAYLSKMYNGSPITFADVQTRFGVPDVDFFNGLLLDAQLLSKPVDPQKIVFKP
jgi:NitT/TauT family transport system substrate-binding protein